MFLTILCVLIVVCKVTKLYIEVNGLVIRRLVCETKTVNPFLLDNKVVLCAYLLPEVMNLFACWAVYLFTIQNESSPIWLSHSTVHKRFERYVILGSLHLCDTMSNKYIITIGYSKVHENCNHNNDNQINPREQDNNFKKKSNP